MKINKQKLLINFCFTFLILHILPFGAVYADSSESLFRSLMLASLKAQKIQMTALGLGIADGVRDTLDFLATPFRIVANDFVYVDYTTPIDAIDEYFDRSQLTIRPNATLIDGVPYTNIWLSKDAAEQFRINSFDIITAWNIASESNGTFVSGYGHVCNIPVFNLGTQKKSPIYVIPPTIPPVVATFYAGDLQTLIFKTDDTHLRIQATYPDNWTNSMDYNANATVNIQATISNNYGLVEYSGMSYISRNFNRTFTSPSPYLDTNSFDFDWIAAEIPLDAELPDNYGLNIQIPTSQVSNWVENYGDTYINQVINMDTTDNDLMVAVQSLLDIVDLFYFDADGNLIINYGPDPEPGPVPTPTPTPPPAPTPPIPTPSPVPGSDIISETPWAFLEQWLQNIRDILRAIYEYVQQIVEYYLENIHADLYFLEQKIEEIIDKLEEFGDEISNKLSLIYADIGDITVDIGSFLDDFIIDLEQAPIKLADKTIDILKLAFLPILTRLRNALGIWHYVTEWLASISGPFSYFVNILSSAFPAAMTPIYACVAGTLCILVYKRFGR